MESKFFKGPLKDFLDSTSEWKFQREKHVSLLPFRFHVARLISISIWSTSWNRKSRIVDVRLSWLLPRLFLQSDLRNHHRKNSRPSRWRWVQSEGNHHQASRWNVCNLRKSEWKWWIMIDHGGSSLLGPASHYIIKKAPSEKVHLLGFSGWTCDWRTHSSMVQWNEMMGDDGLVGNWKMNHPHSSLDKFQGTHFPSFVVCFFASDRSFLIKMWSKNAVQVTNADSAFALILKAERWIFFWQWWW